MAIVLDSIVCTPVLSTTDFKIRACCFYANITAIMCKYKDNIQFNLYYEVAYGTMEKWPYKTGDL